MLVAAAAEPLAQAWVAQQVIKRLGREVLDSDWAGAGGFRNLLEQAALPGVALDRAPPGWLLDPARHQAPAAPAADPHLVRMATLVRRLLGLLGNIPMLGPDRLDFLLEQLAARLPVTDAAAQDIRNGISEAARAAGLEVSAGAVNAVMHRIGLAGFDWQAMPEAGTPQRLREALLDNIRQQMQQQRLDMGEEDAALLADWVGLARPSAAGFAPPGAAPLADLGEEPAAAHGEGQGAGGSGASGAAETVAAGHGFAAPVPEAPSEAGEPPPAAGFGAPDAEPWPLPPGADNIPVGAGAAAPDAEPLPHGR